MKKLLLRWAHFIRNRPNLIALLVQFLIIVLALPLLIFVVMPVFTSVGRFFGFMKEVHGDYHTASIHSKAWVIPEYYQKVPRIIFEDGQDMFCRIPGHNAAEYLEVGDSIAKEANQDKVTVYKYYKDSTVISIFDHDGTIGGPYSGLVSRRVERRASGAVQ